MIETLKQHVLSGGMINEEQAKELAAVPDKEALYEAAHQIPPLHGKQVRHLFHHQCQKRELQRRL
jgi:hypothetical protein